MKATMTEHLKNTLGLLTILGNSMIQWVSDADTTLKLVATVIAVPFGYFSARFMYYQQQIKRLELEEKRKK